MEIKKEKYYQCNICKFNYKTKELAKQCEDYCEKYNACSLEITKHAIKNSNEKKNN